MCLGLKESIVLPLLLSNLTTTELCLMFLIEKYENNVLYKSRNCNGFQSTLCDECKETFDTVNHFHHLYLKQTCNEFKNGLQKEKVSDLESPTKILNNCKEELVNDENKDNDLFEKESLPREMALHDNDAEEKKPMDNVESNSDPKKLEGIGGEEQTKAKNKKKKKKILEEEFLHICKECGEVFKFRHGLEKHRNKTHSKILDCQFCSDQEFKGLKFSKLRTHLLISHMEEKENPVYLKIVKEEEKECKCSTCDAIFTNTASLKAHVKKNHMAHLYSCTECGKGYNSESSLDIHKKTHEDAPRPCEFCGLILKNEIKLGEHIRNHHTQNGGNCGICNKYFITRQRLLKHNHVHLNVKNAACPKCGKKFKSEYTVNLHIKRVHEGARPFGCERCDYKASSIFNLNLHRKKMHNINEKYKIGDYIEFVKSGSHPSIGADAIPLILSFKHDTFKNKCLSTLPPS